MKQPGVRTTRTVLNVFGPSGNGSRYILDSLKVERCIHVYTLLHSHRVL